MLSAGQKLYLLRIQKGMTQTMLSARSGIPQANLSKIEQGKQDPTISTLLKICLALEIRPADLFEEGPPQASPSLTRTSVERIAKGVLAPTTRLSPGEREIADLLRSLVPVSRRPIRAKKVYSAWYELKSRLPAPAIRMLVERIQDEEARRKARAERDYEQLSAGLKKILGGAR